MSFKASEQWYLQRNSICSVPGSALIFDGRFDEDSVMVHSLHKAKHFQEAKASGVSTVSEASCF